MCISLGVGCQEMHEMDKTISLATESPYRKHLHRDLINIPGGIISAQHYKLIAWASFQPQCNMMEMLMMKQMYNCMNDLSMASLQPILENDLSIT